MDTNTEDRHLGVIGAAYINSIEEILIEEHDDLNLLLYNLPDLKLEENYLLDDYRPRKSTNSTLWLYVRDKTIRHLVDSDFKYRTNNFFYALGINRNKCRIVSTFRIGGIPILKYRKKVLPKFPFLYISLPFTEAAIWQAYLLWQTFHVIGMRWHGEYERRLFINLPNDIEKIREERQVKRHGSEESEGLISKCREVYSLPSLILSNEVAFITHCWFSQWGGLLQMTCRVEYNKRKRQITKFEIVGEKVLVKYDCGIMY